MRVKLVPFLMIIMLVTLWLQLEAAPAGNDSNNMVTNKPSMMASLLDRARQQVGGASGSAAVTTVEPDGDDDNDNEADDDDDDDEDDDDDDDDNDDDDDDGANKDIHTMTENQNRSVVVRSKEMAVQTAMSRSLSLSPSSSLSPKIVTDLFGNRLKIDRDHTYLIGQSTKRDLGLLTIKALLLGPIIGLTLKAALFRGLLWAVAAYVIHLFFPSLLSALGLGTGLVGFARQLQPDYAQMLLPHLADIPSSLHNALPSTFNRFATQYRTLFQPVVESIRTIPEGQCRFRGVCETANYLVRNTQFMSHSLQRISATVYLNFGTDYSKAWLDGIVQSDCAAKYSQCPLSPFSMVTNRLAETIKQI